MRNGGRTVEDSDCGTSGTYTTPVHAVGSRSCWCPYMLLLEDRKMGSRDNKGQRWMTLPRMVERRRQPREWTDADLSRHMTMDLVPASVDTL
jgi:hypothetical protein